jgi:hypothetical protein
MRSTAEGKEREREGGKRKAGVNTELGRSGLDKEQQWQLTRREVREA